MLLHPTRVAAVLLCVSLLAACGTRTSAGSDAGAGGTPTDASGSPEGPRGKFGAEVLAVEKAPDGLRLTIRTDYDTDDFCVTNPGATTMRENDVVYISASQDEGDPGDPGCLEKPSASFVVRVPEMQAKDVVSTGMGPSWRPTATTSYARCSEELGCYPPADRCDPIWTRLVTKGVELPPEKRVDVLACANGSMVADVDAVITGCQSVDGSTPPTGCADSGVHARWYAQFVDNGWNVVASGTAGCADVAAVPDFPRELCAGLPPR